MHERPIRAAARARARLGGYIMGARARSCQFASVELVFFFSPPGLLSLMLGFSCFLPKRGKGF